MSSPPKKQIILPQVGQKKPTVAKTQPSPGKNAKRGIQQQQPKNIQIKKPETITQQHQQTIQQTQPQQQQQQIQLINSPYPIIRPASR
jgi:histone-lysine N-methyltransferase MLL1